MNTIKVKPLNKSSYNKLLPDEICIPASITCPHCYQKNDSTPKQAFFTYKLEETSFMSIPISTIPSCYDIISIYLCSQCQDSFIARYKVDLSKDPKSEFSELPKGEFLGTYPSLFPPLTQKISPNFIKTFEQAKISKQMNLDEACYPTYRKALELFIKDFLDYNDISRKDANKLTDYINKLKLNIFTIPADKVRDDGNTATHTPNFNSDDIEQNLIYFVNMLTMIQKGLQEKIYENFSELLKEKEQKNPKSP